MYFFYVRRKDGLDKSVLTILKGYQLLFPKNKEQLAVPMDRLKAYLSDRKESDKNRGPWVLDQSLPAPYLGIHRRPGIEGLSKGFLRKLKKEFQLFHRVGFVSTQKNTLLLTNEILLSFRKNFNKHRWFNILEQNSCELIKITDDFWKVRVLDQRPVAPLELANRFAEDRQVYYAEPNFIQKLRVPFSSKMVSRRRKKRRATSLNLEKDLHEKEDLFQNQWHFQEKYLGAIQPLEAWRRAEYGSSEIRIAIIDGVILENHNDLSGQFDGVALPNRGEPTRHGTRVAGIIGAALNESGLVGVAPRCRLISLPLNSPDPGEDSEKYIMGETSDIYELIKIASKVADILLRPGSLEETTCLTSIINQAVHGFDGAKGLVIVAAAGNNSKADQPDFPANLPTVLSVGANKKNGQWLKGTCFQGVDIYAPGKEIVTTDSNRHYAFAFKNTSAAAPMAAGVAALMLCVNPNLTPIEIRDIIIETATAIPSAIRNRSDSMGPTTIRRIHAGKAVEAAENNPK